METHQNEQPSVDTAKRRDDPAAALSPAGAGGAAGRLPSLVDLQRSAGNRVVAGMLEGSVQRVAVTGVPTGETLYNQSAAGGQAGAAHYSMTANYDMTRTGDTAATVSVKIKFLSQSRNTVPPPPGAPAGAPAVGQLVGPQTEIPAGDPRRAWATTMAADAVRSWNGRLTLVGEEWNAFRANTRKSLPVTFQAVPVWGLAEEAHNTVIVHPPAVQGGSAGNPIDAGNYYMNKNDQVYPANDAIIYAHEYGHLLGIPDEYSQSNAQMNALLHQAAPAGAASAQAALDRATVERMTLAALTVPLRDQLNAAMPQVTDALRAQRPLVKTKMSQAARAGAVTPAVRDELVTELTAAADPTLGREVPPIVAFETSANFSARDRAGEGVEAGFNAGALASQISNAYVQALLAPQSSNVAVAGLGDVRINMTSAVYGAAGAGSPTAGAASGEAASVVGPAGAPGLPAVAPPASLVGQISAIPGTWAAAGSALEAAVTPGAFATKMQAALQGAAAATAAATAALPPGTAPPRIPRAGALYRRAYQMVTNASKAAATQVAADLITATVGPVLTASVTAFQSSIQTEVTRLMTTPPTAVAAAGPPDANMAAIVAAMKTRLDAAKAATAGSGRDPLGAAGGTAPAQDVTYSYQGLMGSNATTAMRPDQFQPVVSQFNSKLKTFLERAFHAEVT